MAPLFSIVIPVYNVAPFLHESLDSVLAQTFENWEALCVDDGSTDGSGDILDEYAAKDARFKVVHQNNAGVSSARNAALDMAQGEWLCFLDSDDKVECHWLEDIADGAKQHPEADWIRMRYRDLIDGREAQPWPEGHWLYECKEVITDKDVVPAVWRKLSRAGMPGLNAFRRSLVGEKRYAIGMIWSEDILFSAMVAMGATTCVVIANDDYRYRIRIGSAARSAQNAVVLLPFLENILPIWKDNPGHPEDMTFLVTKNFRRLFGNGGRCSMRDGFRLNHCVRRLRQLDGFLPAAITSRKSRFCWQLFLLTGLSVFLHRLSNPWCIVSVLAKTQRA